MWGDTDADGTCQANSLTGPLTPWLPQLTNLQALRLGVNKVCGLKLIVASVQRLL